jgi:hypothetical protein
LLQLATPGIGLENEIENPTPFPLSIEEDCFDNDIGNSSKDLKFEPAGQDLEEFMASKENLLELFAIISRNWSIAIEEDGSYIQIYPDPGVGLNILLLDEASSIDMQPLKPSTKILQW